MTNDLLKEILKIGDKMKPFHVKPKEKALVTILDIHKFKKKKHNNTTYYLFQAIIESVDGKQENQNNTYIQLPSKKVIYPLFKSIVASPPVKDHFGDTN